MPAVRAVLAVPREHLALLRRQDVEHLVVRAGVQQCLVRHGLAERVGERLGLRIVVARTGHEFVQRGLLAFVDFVRGSKLRG